MDRITHFSGLVERQPTNELFRFSLAQALLAAGRDAEAEPHLRHCVAAKADWMIPRILLGKLLLRAGRATEARPLITEALRLAVSQNHETPEAELRTLLAELGPAVA
jgi:predicted Zn-dependent protease